MPRHRNRLIYQADEFAGRNGSTPGRYFFQAELGMDCGMPSRDGGMVAPYSSHQRVKRRPHFPSVIRKEGGMSDRGGEGRQQPPGAGAGTGVGLKRD